MASIPYDPDDEVPLAEWLSAIGEVLDAEEWAGIASSLVKKLVISTVGELRDQLDSDVHNALRQLGSRAVAIKGKLAEYLVKSGRRPHRWATPHTVQPQKLHTREAAGRLNAKKFPSQKDRSTLGLELGAKGLAAIELPKHLLAQIEHSKLNPMPAKVRLALPHTTWMHMHVRAARAHAFTRALVRAEAHQSAVLGRQSNHPLPCRRRARTRRRPCR